MNESTTMYEQCGPARASAAAPPREEHAMTRATLFPESIVAQVAPVIRQYADQGERDRRLAPEVVDAMLDAGVFRAWVPQALGGLEMDPVSAMRLFEGIAHAGGPRPGGPRAGALARMAAASLAR
jgi:alkylation response protein AidB-like acyl-CoA dehydrogenase